LKAEQETKQSDVETLIAAKQEQLDSYNSQIDSSNEELEDIAGEISAQKSIISQLREEESSREAAEQASREAASKDSETTTKKEETTTKAANAATGMIWPLSGYSTLSSYFGYRTDPITGETSYHSGLDIPAPSGTPIYAAASGTVSWAQFNSSAGNWTGIYHGDGLYTVYMHQSVMLVSPGDYVEQGEVIGLVGTTGRSTGNHLHFSVILHGNYVDPSNYVSP
jgi:murein DD-endopeptidase MepM/ murein hydrolase activator NlpD